MSILIRNGTVVNASHEQRADVLCQAGKIVAVGPWICRAPADAVVD